MFIKEVFQGRETMGVEGSDNSRHDGVGRGRHGERPNDLKEIVGIFNI